MSDESRESLTTIERIDPYQQWLAAERPKVIDGLYCRDVGTAELTPWARKGVDGAVFNFDGFKGNPRGNDLHIIEIPQGGSTNPERHMYEEIVYVSSGRGATSIWQDEKDKQTFEWHTGSLFAVPLNANAQHFNASGNEKARLISVTTAPTTLRQFHWNEDFMYNCPTPFTDRYGPNSNYFTAEGTMWRSRNNHVWESNFVPDAPNMKLFEWKERGGGGGGGSFKYGANVPGAWRGADVSIKDGGMQMDYPDENPEVHRIFEEEVRAHGAECRMKALSPYCTGEIGPTTEGEWGDA